ncbi:hypothetical protein TcasGA2_TC015865 [Tribolium castaneum]|uniref:Uncharacterized protein n=1 Tax=Tribolium castaneum TaxID=7070 RepID=D2A4F3_TRICA|nr:hypothetical protein TcasGA2_TC015865 [Tribolium castaneum]
MEQSSPSSHRKQSVFQAFLIDFKEHSSVFGRVKFNVSALSPVPPSPGFTHRVSALTVIAQPLDCLLSEVTVKSKSEHCKSFHNGERASTPLQGPGETLTKKNPQLTHNSTSVFCKPPKNASPKQTYSLPYGQTNFATPITNSRHYTESHKTHSTTFTHTLTIKL